MAKNSLACVSFAIANIILYFNLLSSATATGPALAQTGRRKIHSYIESRQLTRQSSAEEGTQKFHTTICKNGTYISRIKDNLPYSLFATCIGPGQLISAQNNNFTNNTEPMGGSWIDCNEEGTDRVITDVKGFSFLTAMWFRILFRTNTEYLAFANWTCNGWDRWVGFGQFGPSESVELARQECPDMSAICGLDITYVDSPESTFVGTENVTYVTFVGLYCCGLPREFYWSGIRLETSGLYNGNFVRKLSPKKWLADEGVEVPSAEIINPTPSVLNLFCNPGEYIHKIYINAIPNAFSIAFFFDWWHGGGIFGPSYSFGYFQFPLIVNDFYCKPISGPNTSTRLAPDFYSQFNIPRLDIYGPGVSSTGIFLECDDHAIGIGSHGRFHTTSDNNRQLRADYSWICSDGTSKQGFVETQTHLELWEEIILRNFTRTPFSCPFANLFCGVQATIRNSTKDFILSDNEADVYKGLTYSSTSYDRKESFTTEMPIEGYFFNFICCPTPNPDYE